MSQEIIQHTGDQAIVMKSGLVLWLSKERAEKLQEVLTTLSGHRFIRIDDKTINTAEVEGVYSPEKYEDLCKVKQGMWQCEYRNWHNKGKRECECAREAMQRARRAREAAEEHDRTRPQTPEERAANLKAVKSIGEYLRAKGILGGPKTTADMPADRTCTMCPAKLTGNLRYYCSGACVAKARERGVYGHEAEQKERAEALATLD